MRNYEFTYILIGTLDDAAVAQSAEKYVKFIQDRDGKVTHHEIWGRRRFAYEIDKHTEGHYVHMRFAAPATCVAELNRALHFDEDAVRTLVVLDEEWERRNREAAAARGAGAVSSQNTEDIRESASA